MSENKIIISKYKNTILYMYKDEKQPIEYQLFSNDEDYIGNIYVCEIKDISQKIDASFVNYGNGRKGYLESTKYKCGTILPLQLVKAGTSTKAPVFSDKLSIAGLNVLVTDRDTKFSISKKLNDEQRKTLLNDYSSIFSDLEYGITLRTNSINASFKDIIMEADVLAGQLDDIKKTALSRTVGTILYNKEYPFVDYCLSVNPMSLKEIITDDKELYDVLNETLIKKINSTNPNVELKLYEDKLLCLNKLYSIETGLKKALEKKVWLNSGAYIIIEKTEALTTIDVNTGKTVINSKEKEKTYYSINIEATYEIARQIRLRNLSGIIIIDYINMDNDDNNRNVIYKLKELIKNDSVKTVFHDMTKLSLVEITRQKKREPLFDQIRRAEKENG